MSKQLVKWLVIAVVVAAFAVFLSLHGLSFLSFAHLKEEQGWLQDGFHQRPALFLGGFAAAYIIAAALSLPGAALFTLAAGAAFGVVVGTGVALMSSAIGASLAFLSARYALRDSIEGRFRARLATINHGLDRDGAFYLVTLRLIAVIPFFVVNLAMGVTRIRLPTFFFASLVGMLPGALVYANAGTRLGQLKSPGEILSLPVIAAFAALAVLPWIAKGGLAWWRWRRTTGRFPRPAQFDYDLAIIGAGAAGLTAAAVAVQLGAKVVLVERERMGGECLYTGCVPSKALIQATRLLARSRQAAALGFTAMTTEWEFSGLMARLREVIMALEPHDCRARFQAMGVTCLAGNARLVSPFVVTVNGQALSSRSIMLATGGRPRLPAVPGFAEIGALTTETIWDLRALPRRLVVIGGGPVGCELGQCFARLGSAVTLITADDQVLGREDLDIAQRLDARLRAEGVRLLLGERVVRCAVEDGEKVVYSLGADGEQRCAGDAVLVALGKVPNTAGFGLEALGIAVAADGRLETDEFQRTNFPNIVACGDVSSKLLFTHVASAQAWRGAANALLAPFSHQRADTAAIPWITFTEPEVGRVGVSEAEAIARGIAIEVTRYELAENDRAVIDGAGGGVVKVITERGRDTILGAAVVGPGAAELIGAFTTAIAGKKGLNSLATALHAYPTYGEAINRVATIWRKAHTPTWQLVLLGRYLRLRRTPARWRLCVALTALVVAAVLTAGVLLVGAHGAGQRVDPPPTPPAAAAGAPAAHGDR